MHPVIALSLFGVAFAWLSGEKSSKASALQKQFDEFHSKIKLDNDDERAKLREKREILVAALREKLDSDVPAFETFNQGSYSTHTGVVPVDGNYDIDIGIIFDCKKSKYPDPVFLKKKIYAALDTHGRTVNIRRPCVTVNYIRDGEVDYHVDLAIYVKRDDGLLDLAKGKENSRSTNRVWEASNPRKLTEHVCNAFSDSAELAQFRRCIRYLKRWRHVRFSRGAPFSIALTLAARKWFKPRIGTSGKPLDLLAMLNWVSVMLEQFENTWTADGCYKRFKVELPVSPHLDLMEAMTRKQMEAFEEKLKSLRDALQLACDEKNQENACRVLRTQFGHDFPMPGKITAVN
jgi:hypothetical protein